MTRLWLIPIVAFAAFLPLPISAEARACDEWNAAYLSRADEDGNRVRAVFGEQVGASNPLPFTLTGLDAAGRPLWRHDTAAWCFLGSGGCHVGLRLEGETIESADFTQSVPIQFVHASKGEIQGPPQILVLSGLTRAFLEASRPGSGPRFDIDRFGDGPPDETVPPDVFYFDRCR